jgi:hypothetical protein
MSVRPPVRNCGDLTLPAAPRFGKPSRRADGDTFPTLHCSLFTFHYFIQAAGTATGSPDKKERATCSISRAEAVCSG